MRQFSLRHFLIFAVDVLLLIMCCINAFSVLERARVPFSVRHNDQFVVISEIHDSLAAGNLRTGDALMTWNLYEIVVPELLEFLGDLSAIGQTVEITFTRKNIRHTTLISLVPYYDSPRFLIVTFCVGFITWLVGIFILFSRNKNPAADVLHWALIAFAVSIMITWGHIDSGSWFSVGSRVLFFISYTLTPALFLTFTTMFPNSKVGTLRQKLFIVFPIVTLLIVGQSYFHVHAIVDDPVQYFMVFQQCFTVFNIYLLFSFAGMVFSLVHSYYFTVRTADKRRLEWILWGFCASPIPFVLFIKLPQIFGLASGLIPEELTTFFFLLIPFSCAISLVQYNLADIQLIINRSIVYSTLTLFIGIIYTLTILLAATSFDTEKKFTEYIVVGVVILIINLILNPGRKRIQHILDEILFPARVTFRTTSAEIREMLHQCLTTGDVYRILTERLTNIISFESFALYAHTSNTLVLRESKNSGHALSVPLSNAQLLIIKNKKVIAAPSAVNFHRNDIIFDDRLPLETLKCTICIPLLGRSNILLGIAVGKPSTISGRFTEEEVDLLVTICAEAAQTLDRLFVQEQMIIQHEEKQRFEELSNIKSYFVSSVSHELRTPLTSIRMFAEMLRLQRTLSQKRQKEYLQIIEGESERLSRLVDNVLDFAAIERKGKEYHFDLIDLPNIVHRAVNATRYQVIKQNAVLKISIAKNIPPLYADPDALEEACINLLSNALKYSIKNALVHIRLRLAQHKAIIEVTDCGIGIPKIELRNIFENFYRINDSRFRQSGGVGLGLALVKHIVEAHGGEITVRSVEGKGSTFTIRLPLK